MKLLVLPDALVARVRLSQLERFVEVRAEVTPRVEAGGRLRPEEFLLYLTHAPLAGADITNLPDEAVMGVGASFGWWPMATQKPIPIAQALTELFG